MVIIRTTMWNFVSYTYRFDSPGFHFLSQISNKSAFHLVFSLFSAGFGRLQCAIASIAGEILAYISTFMLTFALSGSIQFLQLFLSRYILLLTSTSLSLSPPSWVHSFGLVGGKSNSKQVKQEFNSLLSLSWSSAWYHSKGTYYGQYYFSWDW